MSDKFRRVLVWFIILVAGAMASHAGQPVFPWSAPATLNTNADWPVVSAGRRADLGPRVIANASGVWTAVWVSEESLDNLLTTSLGPDPDILFARSVDVGTSWSVSLPVNSNATTDVDAAPRGQDRAPVIAGDGADRQVVVWDSSDFMGGTTGDDADIYAAFSNDAGQNWSALGPVNPAANDGGITDSRPAVAMGLDGTAVAAWQRGADLVAVARSMNQSSWIDLQDIMDPDGFDKTSPDIVTNGAGVWMVTAVLSGLNQEPFIGVAISEDNGETWTAMDAVVPSNANRSYGAPVIATDGRRWIIVAPASFANDEGFGLDNDLFWVASGDNGATWTAPEALNTDAATDTGQDGAAGIATDGRDNFIVTWERDTGEGQQILTTRSAIGGGGWIDPVLLSTNDPEGKRVNARPDIAGDGTGNWIAVWQSAAHAGNEASNSLDLDVLASTVSFTGALDGRITSGGIPVPCAALRLVNEQDTVQRTATTGKNGVYRFQSVPAGEYTLLVFPTGFDPSIEEVSVIRGQRTRVDLELGPNSQIPRVAGLNSLRLNSDTYATALCVETWVPGNGCICFKKAVTSFQSSGIVLWR